MSSQFTDLRNLVSQKEKEWKEAVERRLQQLEEDLAAKAALLEDREAKLSRLKEDFKFNVSLLNDRDREIIRLENEATASRQRAHAADLAASESAVALDEARGAICALRNDKVALVDEMDRQVGAQAGETERIRRQLELQLDRQRTTAVERERELELEAVRLREELASQRRAMLADLEAALAAREAEAKVAAEENSRRALSAELRCQLLERELEACRNAREAATAAVTEREGGAREAAAAAAAEQLRLQSEVALREAELARQREAIAAAEAAKSAADEALRRQAEQFEHALNERKAAAGEMSALMTAEREEAREKLAAACQTFEAAQFDFEQVEWRLKEEVKQKELLLEQAHLELATLRERADKAEARAEEAKAGQEGDVRALRSELSAKREEAALRRRELAAALERERQADQGRAQAEVDAAARLEVALEAERERVEGLVSGLVAKTGELNARLEEAQETLAQKELLQQGLLHERDLALQSLREHGVPFPRRAALRVPAEHEQRLRELEEDRRRLQEEVAALRAEPEEDKGEKMQEEAPLQPIDPNIQQRQPIDPNSRHLHDLASNASRLRQERIQLLAQCRKQAARLQHLEAQLDSAQRAVREKQTEVDKLQYEVSAGSRHHATELQAARQRVTELEGQLAESRREAEEYFKGNLEQARLNEALEQEVVLAKGRKEEATPGVTFGAQELLIQQLQDELEATRERLRTALEEEGLDVDETGRLRAKLKMAARKIMRLAEENSVLRELSSRLRAAIISAGLPLPSVAANRARPKAPSNRPVDSTARTRLQEVQGLEYALQRHRMAARSRSCSPPERLHPTEPQEETPRPPPKAAERSWQPSAPPKRSGRSAAPHEQTEISTTPSDRYVNSTGTQKRSGRSAAPYERTEISTAPSDRHMSSAALDHGGISSAPLEMSADGSLAELWRELGEVDIGVSTSLSERGLSVRGRAFGEKSPRVFSNRRV